LRLFSFGGYGLALAALALVVFGGIECPPEFPSRLKEVVGLQGVRGGEVARDSPESASVHRFGARRSRRGEE